MKLMPRIYGMDVARAGLVCLALAGCASQPTDPELRLARLDGPCGMPGASVAIREAAGPDREPELETRVRMLLAERQQRIGFERAFLASLASCHR